MTEKSPQNLENNPSPKSPESELSPEVLDMLMEKVKDLDKAGIHYTGVGTLGSMDNIKWEDMVAHGVERLTTGKEVDVLHEKVAKIHYVRDLEKLKSIFEKGIIGSDSGKDRGKNPAQFKELDAKKYREFLKTSDNSLVHFYITGRDNHWGNREHRFKGGINELHDNPYTRSASSITLIINIDDLKEVLPSHTEKHGHSLVKEKRTDKVFSAGSIENISRPYHNLKEEYKDHPEKYFRLPGEKIEQVDGKDVDKELISPNLEYGFVMSPRIKPKKFEGIIFSKLKRHVSPGDSKAMPSFIGWGFNPHKNISYIKEELQDITKDIVKIMAVADEKDPSLLIPIYDDEGNLLWPKQMIYEEVKKFVEDRDKNKEDKKEENEK